MLGYCSCFFLFKRKTAYEMRISDWSSDVCSSDLARVENLDRGHDMTGGFEDRLDRQVAAFERPFHDEGELGLDARLDDAIGRGAGARSAERRVGKGGVSKCRSWWSTSHLKTTQTIESLATTV